MATHDSRVQALAVSQSPQLYRHTRGAADTSWKPCGIGLGRFPGIESRKMRPAIAFVTPMHEGRFLEGKPQRNITLDHDRGDGSQALVTRTSGCRK